MATLPRKLQTSWCPSSFFICIGNRHTNPATRAREANSHSLGVNGELYQGVHCLRRVTEAPGRDMINILESNDGNGEDNEDDNVNIIYDRGYEFCMPL